MTDKTTSSSPPPPWEFANLRLREEFEELKDQVGTIVRLLRAQSQNTQQHQMKIKIMLVCG